MIRLQEVSKLYRTKSGVVKALDSVSLDIGKGEFLVIRGPSGSGKTTVLLTIGGMMRPSGGLLSIRDVEIYSLGEGDRARFRAENIGFVFQMFHLVPYLTVLENVEMAGTVTQMQNGSARAKELIEDLHLSHRMYHKPSELSAGERQRTALARALLNQPAVLLADEPTGNLDPDNAADVERHLARFRQEGGTVVVVTHGTIAEAEADRIVYLKEGAIDRIESKGAADEG